MLIASAGQLVYILGGKDSNLVERRDGESRDIITGDVVCLPQVDLHSQAACFVSKTRPSR